MLESIVAHDFTEHFRQKYQLWKPNNRTAGWPDIGIQLHSEIVWIELKVTKQRIDESIYVPNFAKEQAAFMYKWQRYGGSCLLLVAVLSGQEQLLQYRIIMADGYKQWLDVRNKICELYETLNFNEMHEVFKWFQKTFG